MKKNFSFDKFRIKEKKNNLYFFDAFNNDKMVNNIIRFNSFLKTKETLINKINKSKNEKILNKIVMPKLAAKYQNQHLPKNETKFKADINIHNNTNNNNNNSIHKKKIKTSIPINKANQGHNINQNFIININNNNINNNYQIKMNNNSGKNQKKEGNNNFNFSKIKIINKEDVHKNTNILKSNHSEISDLSCFNSNKKTTNLNSINSFVNNDFDVFSISEESNTPYNCEINLLQGKNNNDYIKENKKIYINPVEFENFCKEINEKLKL